MYYRSTDPPRGPLPSFFQSPQRGGMVSSIRSVSAGCAKPMALTNLRVTATICPGNLKWRSFEGRFVEPVRIMGGWAHPTTHSTHQGPRNLEALTLFGLHPIVNRMVQSQRLDRTFSALSDATRRGILVRLGRGPATVSELAQPFGMSLTGLRKHIHILEEAELVTSEKIGRARQCRLGPKRLEDATRWIDTYRRLWERRLDRFERYLEKSKGGDR